MASTTANRIRTSIRQSMPVHLKPMGFVPRIRNMSLDEAYIDRDFDRYDDVIQEFRSRNYEE